MRLTINDVWPCSVEDLTQEMLRALSDDDFRDLKRNFRKRMRASGHSESHVDKTIRRLKKIREPYQRPLLEPKDAIRKFRPSIILDSIIENRNQTWLLPLKRSRENWSLTLKDFSFIDDANGTLNRLREIAHAECVYARGELNFDDEYVFDIAPYLILGLSSEQMIPFLAGGRMKTPVKKVIEAVQLREFLNMGPFFGLRNLSDVWGFGVRKRRKSGTSARDNLALSATKKEKVADDLVSQINEWLNQLHDPMELSNYGKGNVARIVTEVLDNAERHSQLAGDGDWAIAGFMARRNNLHICNLAIVSLGCSIAESLKTASKQVSASLNDYIAKHQSKKFTPELLTTVFSLQDGVTRYRSIDDGSIGGAGMGDMIEFANALGAKAPTGNETEIVLISGRACLALSPPYNNLNSKSRERARHQWFNRSQMSTDPPDPDHVRCLDVPFPGTLISFRFCIDQSIVSEDIENSDEN